MEVITLLKELKELSTKPVSSSQLSSDFLLQNFSQFEDIHLKELATLSLISSLLPTTNSLPVYTGVQGGERKGEDTKVGGDDANVLGNVFSSKIPTTKPIIANGGLITSTVVTTVPITKPILKGIEIGKSTDVGGSGLKMKEVILCSTLKARGKTILVEKSNVIHQSIITMKQSKPRLHSIICIHSKRSQNRAT
ncbi:unnamed protein product [Lactuca saligna]|uniref:Uncharacterized protein n=1 Tax=Lactuca saligna TaxID=75948 RepID=A0AA35YWR3_LACSI|nr:unnamed protein product [Lactuca saligna]